MFKEEVERLVAEAIESRDSIFLIDLSILPNNHINVTIDGDQGVSVSDCIDVSRDIEHNLDREAQDFSLDVMSAGATSPLVNKRQYHKNIGRKLGVKMNDEAFYEGVLEEVNEDGVKLVWKTREPKPVGKGKHTVVKEENIPFDKIKEAKVIIKF